MKTKEIKLSQKAIDKAVRDSRSGVLGAMPSRCCPVFHALHENGFRVRAVGLSDAWTDSKEITLDYTARNIARLPISMWPDLKPTKFTITIS